MVFNHLTFQMMSDDVRWIFHDFPRPKWPDKNPKMWLEFRSAPKISMLSKLRSSADKPQDSRDLTAWPNSPGRAECSGIHTTSGAPTMRNDSKIFKAKDTSYLMLTWLNLWGTTWEGYERLLLSFVNLLWWRLHYQSLVVCCAQTNLLACVMNMAPTSVHWTKPAKGESPAVPVSNCAGEGCKMMQDRWDWKMLLSVLSDARHAPWWASVGQTIQPSTLLWIWIVAVDIINRPSWINDWWKRLLDRKQGKVNHAFYWDWVKFTIDIVFKFPEECLCIAFDKW